MIVNEKLGYSFVASRGLRQGDPLSPFLLTLVVDVLGRLLDRVRYVGLIEGFAIGRDIVLNHCMSFTICG